MEMIVLGSANRAKKGGPGKGMGMMDKEDGGGSSDLADLFASIREAIKSGDDQAGADALSEFVSSCGYGKESKESKEGEG